MIETVLIADALPLGREEALARGLKLTTTKIVTHPNQVRGWSLDANVTVIDTQQRMSTEKRQLIDYHLSLCTMASRNKGLAQWLRERIEADRAEWTPALSGPRLNGKATARAVLAQCDAHRAILDLHHVRSDGSDLCNEDSDPYPCSTIRALGVAHRDHFGYRTEWKP